MCGHCIVLFVTLGVTSPQSLSRWTPTTQVSILLFPVFIMFSDIYVGLPLPRRPQRLL
jgi:hypothetical protein